MNCTISIWRNVISICEKQIIVNNMSLHEKKCDRNILHWIWLRTPVYKIDGLVNGSGIFSSGVVDFAGFDENRIHDCNKPCCLIDCAILFDTRNMLTPCFQYLTKTMKYSQSLWNRKCAWSLSLFFSLYMLNWIGRSVVLSVKISITSSLIKQNHSQTEYHTTVIVYRTTYRFYLPADLFKCDKHKRRN